jgi:hypothetical protein
MGPMSVSFHVPLMDDYVPVDRTPSTLHDIYHVKVYHDARYSLHVRKALDLWETSNNATDSRYLEKKVRPLKGAVFLLVDDRGTPVLYC